MFQRGRIGWSLLALGALIAPVLGAPVPAPWPTPVGSAGGRIVAAANVAGVYATGETGFGTVEIRDIRGGLIGTLSAADVQAKIPWLTGVSTRLAGLCVSDSGRTLYVAVQDAAGAFSAQGTDAVARYDVQTGAITSFVRLELSPAGVLRETVPMAHAGARLFVGNGAQVTMYAASANAASGIFMQNIALGGADAGGIAFDRVNKDVYFAGGATISRRALTSTGPLSVVGTLGAGVTGLGFSDHAGGGAGLYALSPAGDVTFIPSGSARGTIAFTSSLYSALGASVGQGRSLTAAPDGRLLVGGDTGAAAVSDTLDTRRGFEDWLSDEVSQGVKFGRSLISPDAEPAGWVIDADVQQGWSRFHPATPDAAAWTVLLLLVSHDLTGDPLAQAQVRTILQRYAGRAPDGIAPSRTSDGIYRHWLDPLTGQTKPGWPTEFATLSTMKIVLAAARAREYFPADEEIAASARAIICGVRNWDAYMQPNGAMYFTAAGAGGTTGSPSWPFHEGILFAEQAARFGGVNAQSAYANWLTRSNWPSATYLTGWPISVASAGSFQPAFITAYPMLLLKDFRTISAWRDQVDSVRLNHAAWTDDNAPRWSTVFSAGTTKTGYNADAINNAPDLITTFTALESFAGRAQAGPRATIEAVGAYHGYRTGARQKFAGGASILYRRSTSDPAWQPNSAGLPDVAMGALGLAELLKPGIVDRVLTGGYRSCSSCAADLARSDGSIGQDGLLTASDVVVFFQAFFGGVVSVADIADGSGTPVGDGVLTGSDVVVFFQGFFAGCP